MNMNKKPAVFLASEAEDILSNIGWGQKKGIFR